MKKILAALVLVAITVVGFYYYKQNSTTGWKTFSGFDISGFDIELKYPPGWRVSTNNSDFTNLSISVFRSSDSGGLRDFLTLSDIDDGVSRTNPISAVPASNFKENRYVVYEIAGKDIYAYCSYGNDGKESRDICDKILASLSLTK